MTNLEDKLADHDRLLTDLVRGKSIYEGRIRALTKSVNTMREECKELQDQTNALMSDKVSSERDTLRAKMQALEIEKQRFEAKATTNGEEIGKLTLDNDQLSVENMKLKDDLEVPLQFDLEREEELTTLKTSNDPLRKIIRRTYQIVNYEDRRGQRQTAQSATR